MALLTGRPAPRRAERGYLSPMKAILFISMLCLCTVAYGQTAKQDLAKDLLSPERKAILEALKQKLQPEVKQKPKMVVEVLMVKGAFAYFHGRVKDSTGKDIDFRKTVYKDAVKDGLFDGDGTAALLKKSGGKWKVLTYAVGPTDVAWACWWKEFKAPKEIFDYAETCE